MSEPAISWKTLPLSDDRVSAELEQGGTVMIAEKSRRGSGRRHLRIHHDAKGWFVRVGRRGSGKEYLGRCTVTCFDGRATLFQFTFASQDKFDAEQDRLFCEKYAIGGAV